MSKAILEFDLAEKLDAQEFKVASMSKELWLALYSISNEIIPDLPDQDREKFWEILEDHGITLEELT